jgi:hypothetical protein
MHYFMPFFRNVSVLYYSVLQGRIQSNQQLARSRLMHGIHCGSAIFQYPAFGRRTAQETLMGFMGLRNKKSGGSEHLLWYIWQ